MFNGENKGTGNKEVFSRETGKLNGVEEIDCSALFSVASVGFMIGRVLLDENGQPYDFQILKVNPAFEQIMGLRENEVVGRIGSEVFPDIEQHWIAAFGRAAITGEVIHLSGYFGTLNKYFELSVASPQKELFMAIFTDITEIKVQQDKLNKFYQLQKVMNMVRTILIEATDEYTLYQKICDTLVQIDFVKIAAIALMRDEKSPLKIVAVAAPDECMDYIAADAELLLNPLDGGTFRTALETEKTVIINNMITDERVAYCRESTSKLNLKSGITLPLIHEGTKLGALLLYSDHEGAFDGDVVSLLVGLSADINVINGFKHKRFYAIRSVLHGSLGIAPGGLGFPET